MKVSVLILAGLVGLSMTGCIRRANVNADEAYHAQALEAYELGQYERARACIAQADKQEVPWANLPNRTLALRVAKAEERQQGEVSRLLDAMMDAHDEWTEEDRADAKLTLAELLAPQDALDVLYDMDPSYWSAPLRSRYHLLFAKHLKERPELYDTTVTKWTLGVYGLYDAGQKYAAAREALRCAATMKNPSAAILSAKIYNELYRADDKEKALQMALNYSGNDAMVASEVALVRSAPMGRKTAR